MFESIFFVPRYTLLRLVKPTFFLWLLLAIILISYKWHNISTFQLVDNDDYMRLLEVQSWLSDGHWYLESVTRLAPPEGVLMHWSRLPDISLGFVAQLAQLFVEDDTALAVSIAIVPLFYLLVTAIAIAIVAYHISGNIETAEIAAIFALTAPYLSKFMPGSIDHHNIQLMFLALYLASLPLNDRLARSTPTTVANGLFASLSLWIGLENIAIFAVSQFFIAILGYGGRRDYLLFSQKSLVAAGLFAFLFMLLNRPINEFIDVTIDSLSLPFSLLLLQGSLFFYLSYKMTIKSTSIKIKVFLFITLSVVCLFPTLVAFPDILLGPYYNYPDILKKYWLSSVSEAKSIFSYVASGGINSKGSHMIFLVLPAMLSILTLKNKIEYRCYYTFMIVSFLMPLFWQARAFYPTVLISIPVLAVFCEELRLKVSNQYIKTIILVLLIPFTTTLIINVFVVSDSKKSEKLVGGNSLMETIESHKITDELIMSSIDTGATILALSNNQVISAPYHRNVNGNTDSIRFFTTSDESLALQIQKKYHFKYVLIVKDKPDIRILSGFSEKTSVINRLLSEAGPDWLQPMPSTDDSKVKLYSVIEVKNES